VSSTACLPPDLLTAVPGPRSLALATRLRAVESPNVTCLEPDAPIFWERARGANVWDVDENRYVDLDAAFGVAAIGHAHQRVVEAISDQAERLLHGMGDVHPTSVRTRLLETLTALYPGGVAARAILGSSGSDAVEAGLKTALLATGRPGIVAFEGAYHGLSLGALDTTWRSEFREPFSARLPRQTAFARFGDAVDAERSGRDADFEVGAILVEPVQGRGGIRIPEPGFLEALREVCDANGWLLIVDEIYTGLGRTGIRFACEHEGVIPDVLCVGKALGGGMPIAACLARAEVMAAWPISTGESLHTQTFLGHPVGCAAALAALAVIEEESLADAARDSGRFALAYLKGRLADHPEVTEVRGSGLMLGIECQSSERVEQVWVDSLKRGVITLPAGDDGRVLSLTPPLGIPRDGFEDALDRVCRGFS
jgi:4-aminobutyrate aminotransferase/(S)-3-amino-2-methylpropionate transaminase